MIAFQRHVLVAENLQPHAIDLVEDTYPELVATGHQSVADELLAGDHIKIANIYGSSGKCVQ